MEESDLRKFVRLVLAWVGYEKCDEQWWANSQSMCFGNTGGEKVKSFTIKNEYGGHLLSKETQG